MVPVAAWLLKGHADNPHHGAAGQLLSLSKDEPVADFLEHAASELSDIDLEETDLWQYFCPPAAEADRDAENMAAEIVRRRRLSSVEPARHPLRDPATELLFTTNALISPPLEAGSPNIPQALRAEAGASPSNRRISGTTTLCHLMPHRPRMRSFTVWPNWMMRWPRNASLAPPRLSPCRHRHIDLGDPRGHGEACLRLCPDLVSSHLKLRHLRVFLFDETHCRDIVDAICPGDSHAETVFGVNGAVSRAQRDGVPCNCFATALGRAWRGSSWP